MVERDISSLVKRIRMRLGLTQEQFAREVGVTFSTVNQWENGHRRPQPYLLNRLLEMEAARQEEESLIRKKGERKSKRER